MILGNKLLFNKKNYDLIMYGCASVMSSKSVLEGVYSTLSITEIKTFDIIGNDVFCELNIIQQRTINNFGNVIPITSLFISNPLLGIEGNCFKNNLSITDVNVVSTYIGGGVFYGCQNLKMDNVKIYNINSLSSSVFYNNKAGGTLYLPNVTTFNDYAINQGGAATVGGFNINAPELITAGTYSMHSVNGSIYAPKLANLGDPSVNTYAFYGINSASILTVSSFLSTNNGGGEDADIAYVRSRGATIIFV